MLNQHPTEDNMGTLCYRVGQAEARIDVCEECLEKHSANGSTGHVQRHEINALKEGLADMGAIATDTQKKFDQFREDYAVEHARRSSSTKLLVALVGVAGMVLQAFLHYLK